MNRFRTFAEPAVIAHIDHDLRTVADELPGVPGDCVFETDQGNDSDSVTVLLKDEWFKRRAGGEVLLNDATGDPFEERKFAAERDVFPKRNKVNFSMRLIGRGFTLIRVIVL